MPPGRRRDPEVHQRILDATFALLADDARLDVRIDDIAATAGVGKQTIYRWWPSRRALALDALLHATMDATPFPDTGDAHDDLRAHLRKVAALFASPTGSMLKAVIADAQRDDTAGQEFVERFWQPRRALSLACMERGVERGQVRPDLDVEAVLDALYGPLWIRLIFGHLPVTTRLADDIVELIWPTVKASPRGRRPPRRPAR